MYGMAVKASKLGEGARAVAAFGQAFPGITESVEDIRWSLNGIDFWPYER